MDWSKLGQDILAAVLPILVTALLGLVMAQIKLVLARAKQYQPDLIEALAEAANLAVGAAEQSKLAGLIEEKKCYAITVAEAFLEARGFKIDLHLIEAAIERAVLENFPKDADPAKPQ